MVDYLIMLLSTDWFGPYWSTIGVNVLGTVSAPLRAGCRQLVKQILSGEESYYVISFSDRRKAETRAAFDRLMLECGIPEDVRKIPDKWAALTDDELKSAWICNDFIADVLSSKIRGDDLQLDSRIVGKLAVARKNYYIQPYEFSKICLDSPSIWDGYTRGLTPGQPTLLADNLASVLEYLRLEELWNSVRDSLTLTEKSNFLNWFHQMAKARGRRDILPAFLA